MMLRLPAELMCDDLGAGLLWISDPFFQVLIFLAPQLGGFQDPLAQPLCPGHARISETSMDPFPLLQLEMWAGLAL